MIWEVSKSEAVELEIDKLLFRVAELRGPDYASRWYDALLVAIDSLADFPGPRSYPRSIEESERRRAEVRYRTYNGPDKKPAPSVACHIFFALYDPTQGAILLDGVDLRDYDVASLRQEIGVIFQDYMRYDFPVRDNIGFGRIEQLGDDARIAEAARKSMAAPMIEKLPGGFAQMLGRPRPGIDGRESPGWWRYRLPPEHAAFLADSESPMFSGAIMSMIKALFDVAPEVEQCFRHGGGVHSVSGEFHFTAGLCICVEAGAEARSGH